jgi:sugar (pentulose or hexulose) kinase
VADLARAPARLVAGLDLGSTSLKMLVTDEAGDEVGSAQVPTPWQSGADGTTELRAEVLLAAVHSLLALTTRRLGEVTSAPITAVAICGMAETGMVINAAGRAVAPAFAWFDPRGARQAAAFPAPVQAQFAGRTGLPLGAQVSVAKLAYLRDQGLSLAGLRWLNLPEFVAAALGGRTAVEYSLTSRTGLIDQDTGRPWAEMLHVLGVDESFLPPLVDAGSSFGEIRRDVPAGLAGALLTVAGHDHLVAAEATGGLPADHYHVSLGTAEVLLRVIDAPLGYEARGRLAEHLINEVRHVVPGKHVLVAGVKTGLLLRRVLQAAGINDRAGRDALDAAVMALPYEGGLPGGAIEVTGARNNDGVLKLALRTDGVSPAEVFGAVLRHSNDEIALLIQAMDRELPPAVTATLTGGWAGMAAVRRARSHLLPSLSASDREQETAYGATRVAARLLRTTSPRIGTAS